MGDGLTQKHPPSPKATGSSVEKEGAGIPRGSERSMGDAPTSAEAPAGKPAGLSGEAPRGAKSDVAGHSGIKGLLAELHCLPCEGGVSPLTRAQAGQYLGQVPAWALSADGTGIFKEWVFRDFGEAVAFVNRVAELAEGEGHHPDISIRAYRRVRLDLTTHAIRGLSENDFILAAKVERLGAKTSGVRAGQSARRPSGAPAPTAGDPTTAQRS